MISVIVPIYNIQDYLPKCINSLAAQTLKSVEFLLVDDGSTDNSGKIIDEITDPRFCILHTANHGLSAARNYGIEHAVGEWLMFVDGDDWVDRDFCRISYEAALEFDADIVVFQHCHEKNGVIEKTKPHFYPKGIISKEHAIEFGSMVAWNKLYRRDLFERTRYPEGRVYEDIATTNIVICTAKRIAFIPDTLYCHVYRANSISNVDSEKARRDRFLSDLECYNNLCTYGYSAEKQLHLLWSSAIGLLVSAGSNDDSLVKKAEVIAKSIPRESKDLSLKKRITLMLWRKNKRLFDLICKLSGKRMKD